METIREGARGAFVEYLQLALSRTGYSLGIDGVFGPATRRAVLAFQSANGLPADGVVGPRTWTALMPFLRGYGYYTVKSGDTVSSIAKKFFTTPSRVLLANPDILPERLFVGTRLTVPYGFSLVPTGVSYTYALVKILVEGLRTRYPFIKAGTIGTSVMGKNLYYLTIGEGENEVFYNAAHHANEWITTPVLLRFLEDYAIKYSEGGSIYGYEAARLFESTLLFMVPLVNPDGVDLVNGVVPSDSSFYISAEGYAQNYPQIPFPSGWKANISGVDPNLSYPAEWETAREIKFAQGFTSPAPRDYVGTAPLSAPESAAVYEFTRAHDFLLTLSYHTQGEVIFWQFLDYTPENAREIGELFSRASGYALADVPYESSFAGYKDWFIQTYRRPGYTIEAGSGQNPLPIREFPSIYEDNLGILTLGLAIFSDTP